MRIWVFVLLGVECFLSLTAQGSKPNLPPDTLILERIFEEIRSPIALKLREIRQNFHHEERQPGIVRFFKNSKNNFTLQYEGGVSSDKKSARQQVTLIDKRNRPLFQEVIESFGEELEIPPPQTHAYFNSRNVYALGNKHAQTVSILVNQIETFRLESSQGSESGRHVKTTRLYFRGKLVLTEVDRIDEAGNFRVVEWARPASKRTGVFEPLPKFKLRRSGYPAADMRIEVKRDASQSFDNYRFFSNGDEIFGQNGFSQSFSVRIYEKFIARLALHIVDVYLRHYVPETESIRNTALSFKFLDELIDIKNKLEQSKTNPSLINIIQVRINSYIDAIQRGKLQVNDNRD